jgi:hypothetical protein
MRIAWIVPVGAVVIRIVSPSPSEAEREAGVKPIVRVIEPRIVVERVVGAVPERITIEAVMESIEVLAVAVRPVQIAIAVEVLRNDGLVAILNDLNVVRPAFHRCKLRVAACEQKNEESRGDEARHARRAMHRVDFV